jgi:hypothetical protein
VTGGALVLAVSGPGLWVPLAVAALAVIALLILIESARVRTAVALGIAVPIVACLVIYYGYFLLFLGGHETHAVERPIPRGLIVPEQGMAGVRLGMTRAEVRAVLGGPDDVRHLGEAHTGVPIDSWRYRKAGLRVDLHGPGGRFTVGGVAARNAPPRTAAGVGVGSSEPAVRRTLGPVRCGPAGPGTRDCWRGSSVEGRPQTIFRIRGGRVYEVEILEVF